eukprot:scaffold8982_cov125-Isochrysis_galbana.AAC.3
MSARAPRHACNRSESIGHGDVVRADIPATRVCQKPPYKFPARKAGEKQHPAPARQRQRDRHKLKCHPQPQPGDSIVLMCWCAPRQCHALSIARVVAERAESGECEPLPFLVLVSVKHNSARAWRGHDGASPASAGAH